jgi:hypothetical protein
MQYEETLKTYKWLIDQTKIKQLSDNQKQLLTDISNANYKKTYTAKELLHGKFLKHDTTIINNIIRNNKELFDANKMLYIYGAVILMTLKLNHNAKVLLNIAMTAQIADAYILYAMIDRSFKKYEKSMIDAINLESGIACGLLGEYYARCEKYRKAFDTFNKGIHLNDIECCRKLVKLYYNLRNIPMYVKSTMLLHSMDENDINILDRFFCVIICIPFDNLKYYHSFNYIDDSNVRKYIDEDMYRDISYLLKKHEKNVNTLKKLQISSYRVKCDNVSNTQIKKYITNEDLNHQNKYYESKCPICMEDYSNENENNKVKYFHCGHHTCSSCIVDYLKSQANCHTCKCDIYMLKNNTDKNVIHSELCELQLNMHKLIY